MGAVLTRESQLTLVGCSFSSPNAAHLVLTFGLTPPSSRQGFPVAAFCGKAQACAASHDVPPGVPLGRVSRYGDVENGLLSVDIPTGAGIGLAWRAIRGRTVGRQRWDCRRPCGYRGPGSGGLRAPR